MQACFASSLDHGKTEVVTGAAVSENWPEHQDNQCKGEKEGLHYRAHPTATHLPHPSLPNTWNCAYSMCMHKKGFISYPCYSSQCSCASSMHVYSTIHPHAWSRIVVSFNSSAIAQPPSLHKFAEAPINQGVKLAGVQMFLAQITQLSQKAHRKDGQGSRREAPYNSHHSCSTIDFYL